MREELENKIDDLLKKAQEKMNNAEKRDDYNDWFYHLGEINAIKDIKKIFQMS
ncbi:hypothetical protein MHH96_20935 [Niallia sp. FSL K6-0212]|uniref:hypothetical protein n=1 Tax=Niallia sp. FSL K6-0212 TaxID=2921423 RepID=UPI0030F8AEEE